MAAKFHMLEIPSPHGCVVGLGKVPWNANIEYRPHLDLSVIPRDDCAITFCTPNSSCAHVTSYSVFHLFTHDTLIVAHDTSRKSCDLLRWKMLIGLAFKIDAHILLIPKPPVPYK